MREEPTTAVVQRRLDALQGETRAEPLIRDLLERAVDRLRGCAPRFSGGVTRG